MTTIAAKVTERGILIPRRMVKAWGKIEEVEIEQRLDGILIRPKSVAVSSQYAQIVREMKEAGLIENLPWEVSPPSPEVRIYLTERLSQGTPLSESILMDRDEYA